MNNIKDETLSRAESLLREWLPDGRKEGTEWRCGGLQGGKGRSLSISLATGAWTDHATSDKGGDLVSLYAAIHSTNYAEACRAIESNIGLHRSSPVIENTNDWNLVRSVPENAPSPTFTHYKHGKPSSVWQYRNPDGTTFGYVARFDTNEGKQILPLTYRDNGTSRDWRWKGFEGNRPLYLIHRVKPDGRIIIVEGEKCANALADLLPNENVISWQGGAKAIKFADWSTIKGRDVLVWPDNDEQGIEAAKHLRRILGQKCRILTPPTDKPKKWDCADAIEEGFDCEEFVNSLEEPGETDDDATGLPFDILGVSDDHYHYLPHNGNMIVKITASGHTKQNMMRIAPLQVWEDQFPGSSNVDWDAAVNSLINNSQRMPQFDPKRIRGRGCWIDDESVVFHAGNRLIVNGQPTAIHKFKTKNIYAAKQGLNLYDGEPATAADGDKLITLCRSLSWKTDLDGFILAGWLALSPISGVLHWRPHIWITGPSGTGKTWVFDNIVKDVAGDMVLAVQSNTTEAGIRCSLGSDSIPVIFDEAEAENAAAAHRIDKVMELARQASSEGSSGIVKGTATGGSITHYVRSMFLFSSIGVSSVKKADTSRISSIELVKSNSADQFAHVKQLWRESVMTPKFGEKIRARSIKNADTIRHNASIFSDAAAITLGDKRAGDQIGALIAGAHSLVHDQKINLDQACDLVSMLDLSSLMPESADADEQLCLAHLMGSVINQGSNPMRVSDAVSKALGGDSEALAVVARHGMKIIDGELYVANSGPELERIFKDSPWGAGKWTGQLARIPNSRRVGVVRFSPYSTQRAVCICLQA